MRVRLGMIVWLALGFWLVPGVAPALGAQAGADGGVYAPLQHGGTLVVWWIEPTTDAQRAQLALEKIVGSVPRIPLDQRSASELGQNASTFGSNASNTGQTASSYGTNASNAGQTASSYGTSASNIGRSASDTGQTASSYGQTASTLGQNASTFGVAASDTDKRPAESSPVALTVQQRELTILLQTSFPGLNVKTVAVPDVQLREKLVVAQNAGTFPDVVIADGPLPKEWRAIAANAGVVTLGVDATLGEAMPRLVVQEFNDQPVSPVSHPEAAILLRAPHLEAPRAFVTWLREGANAVLAPRLSEAATTVAEVALRAATAVLNGGSASEADPAIAEFAPGQARAAALASTEPQASTAVPLRLDVLSAAVVGDRFAVVKLRAVLGSRTAFGLAYPLLVLRRAGRGSWKVLQISTGLPEPQASHAEAVLRQYTVGQAAAQLTAVSGLLPMDGDTRSPQPELGWQRGEGGALFVVEWQQGGKCGWMSSNLFFVPDDGMRSQTRVNAQFAQAGGPYRWRVWTVGAGGATQVSAWSTFTVVGR